MVNTSDTVKAYTAMPGKVYSDLQNVMYEPFKAENQGRVKEIVERNQQQYGLDSEYVAQIQEGIKQRNIKQAEKLEKIREKYKDVKGADVAITAGTGIGNMVPSMVVGATTGAPVIGTSVFSTNVFGGAMGEALNSGATIEQAAGYATADAALETGVEVLFGGIPALGKGILGKSIKEATDEVVSRYIKTAAGRMLVNRLIDITGEGVEEVVSEILEPFIRRAFYDKDAENATLKDCVDAFGGGALVAGILGVANFKGNIREYQDIKAKIKANKALTTENAGNAAKIQQTEETAANTVAIQPIYENSRMVGEEPVVQSMVSAEEEQRVQRAAANLPIVEQLNRSGIDTGNAVQKLTEVLTGEKAPAADPNVVERENARVAAIEEAARQGIASAEDVQKVRETARQNIQQSENRAVLSQKFSDEEISRIEELAKMKGYRVVYESDESDNAPNGYIQDGTIYINIAGDSPYFNVAVHEVLHGLKGNAKQWNSLEKSIYRLIGSSAEMTNFADAVVTAYTGNPDSAAYQSLLTDGVLDAGKLTEEVVANFVEEYLPKIAQNEERLMSEIKKDRSFIDGLLDIIRGIKNNLAIKWTKSERAMLDEAERNLVNLMRGESQEQKNKKFSLISGWRRTEIERVGSNLIIDNNHQLESEIKKIYSGESNKTLYVGLANTDVIKNIKLKITDIADDKIDQFLRDNVEYAIRIVPSDLIHFKKDGMKLDEVIQYVKRIPEIITEFDNVRYTIYRTGNALRFDKTFPDGKYYSMAVVSNKKSTLTVHNVFMDKADYINKKRLATPRLAETNAANNTPEASGGLSSSTNNISQIVNKNNGKKSAGGGMYSRQVETYDGESAKSRGIRKKAVYDLADSLGRKFGITDKAGKEILRRQAHRIADQVEQFGFISKANMDNFFDSAVRTSRFTDEKADYAPLKKRIRETGIEPLGGREYLDFLKEYKGKIKFKRGGMPVDILYQELAAEYPEYIDGDISNPADQLWRLGEVYDKLRVKEMSVEEYYGDRADDYIKESYNEYAREVDLFVDRLNSVTRYKKANVDSKAAKDRARGQPAKTYTFQDVQQAYKDSKSLENEIAKLMADTALTENDKSLLDDLQKIKNQRVLAATLKDMQENNPNAKAIYNLYELKQQLARIKEPVREYRKANRDKNRETFMDLLTTSRSWNEKGKFGGLRYRTETFERIIDDVVTDKEAAERLKDMLPRSIHKHVADGTRYKNWLRDKVRRLKLDNEKLYNVEFETEKGHPVTAELTESGLVQIYGEGLVTKEYLDEIGADTAKIAAAADEFRKIYNELIEKINEVYVRNGYKPMEFRKDYFPHFTEEGTDGLLDKVTSWFGTSANAGTLPTEIAGTTYQRSPGRKWNAHALQRMGETTVYDALKGFDNYLETAADVIFLTDDIQNLRSFEEAVRYKYSDKGIQDEIDAVDEMEELSVQEKWERKEEIFKDNNRARHLNNFVQWLHEYTNSLAGKKSIFDRGFETAIGRGIYQMSKDMESRVAANMTVGNLSSALTNIIPIAQMTSQVKEKYILAAMRDTIKNMSKNDGFAYQSDFLVNRQGSELLVNDSFVARRSKVPVLRQWLGIMETVDEFTSNVVVRGKYMQNINEGMSHEMAMQNANEFAAGLMADRSKGALPIIFETKNPFIKALTMFQVEQNNQLQYLLKDLPRSRGDKEKIGRVLMMALLKYSIYSWRYNWLYEKIAGRKPAFSPIDIVADTVKDFSRMSKGEMKASEAVTNAVVNVAEELPFAAAPLGMLGISEDAGRLPIGGALPDFTTLRKLLDKDVAWNKKVSILYKELSKPIFYLIFPAAGGQIKKTTEALYQMAVNKGVSYYTGSDGEKSVQFAIDTTNPKKWVQSAVFGRWSTPEAREYVSSFKGLTKAQTGVFEQMKEEKHSNGRAFAFAQTITKSEKDGGADADGNGSLTSEEVQSYLDKQTNLSQSAKANIFRLLKPDVKYNPYEK